MTGPRFVRTEAFRLGVLFALIFLVAGTLLFALVFWRVSGFTLDQARAVVDSDVEVLLAEGDKSGAAWLAQAVDERASKAESNSSFYLLQAPNGARRAGNLQPLPAVDGAGQMRVRSYDEARRAPGPETQAWVRSVTRPDGTLLAVGRDLGDLDELNRRLWRAFVAAALGAAVLAIAGGALVGMGFVARLETIARTSETIMAGDLGQRIPVRGANDEIDRLSATLNRMLDRIQTLMETTRQVSNDIAHDLRTPLARLRQKLEGVTLRPADADALRATVADAISDVDDILDTFSALLRIAEIEVAGQRAGLRPVDLSRLFLDLAETYEAVAEDAGDRLTAEVAPGVTVEGDESLLTQLLANLVENAIRHCPPGARIAMTLRREPGAAVGEVRDDGPGIPQAERANVFKRFYRLERSRTTAGSGLGLSLVAAIAQIHGASVTVGDAAPGTLVTLRFPLPPERGS
ncbi:HAMP domain-containing histidine kinase [Alsobacter sp. SYSU M60028]|uniref:histidine kinase n=1 Tax=Alsobacter ponti TaxID=2962936 RepID=A0ABT1L9Y7_9HYPH|nr:HAMP domain-containing histidine kinase [Alsobacter ponti]